MSNGPFFHALLTAPLRKLGFAGRWVRVTLHWDRLVLHGEGRAPIEFSIASIVALHASVVTGRASRHTIWLTLEGQAERFALTTPPVEREREGYERVVEGLAASLLRRGLPVFTGHGWLGAAFGLGGLGLVALIYTALSLVLAIHESDAWPHRLVGLAVILAAIALLWRPLMRETPQRAQRLEDLSRAFLWRR